MATKNELKQGRRPGGKRRAGAGATLAILPTALLLAGCVVPAPTTPPGATVVRAEARPGVAMPPARGETSLVVRAAPASALGQDLAGVACRAETPYSTASFTTPAQILMPDLGSAAPSVTVTCNAQTPTGKLSGTAIASPEAPWSNGLGGWPAVGISVGTGNAQGVGVGVGWSGGSAGTSSGTPAIRYRDLRVPLS